MHYCHKAIASYNEVGVAVAVAPTSAPRSALWSLLGPLDKNPLGLHIVDLPVTTDTACAAGQEVWGYPKFVTQIGFAMHGKHFRGTVTDPQDLFDLVTLAGRFGVGAHGPLLDLALYSLLNGQMLRTLVNTRGSATVSTGGSLWLKVSASSRHHPMAERLHAMRWMARGLSASAAVAGCN